MKGKERILDKKNSNLKSKKTTKKKSLQEKGITLIALVVTIIILLILAGVTLNMVLSDNGLFSKTKEATEKYKQAQSDEEDLILKYEYEMAKLQGEISGTETVGEYAMEKEIKEKYEQDIKIGDTVNYDPNISGDGYDGTWKVLGIEDGKILLMSSSAVRKSYEILGVEGYVNGVKNLDDICSEYGKGKGATGARSLRVEDINKITGYNPDKSEKFREGELGEYGAKVTLKRNEEGYINMNASNGQNLTWKVDTFKYISEDGTEKNFDGELVITNNMYGYETDNCKNWYGPASSVKRDMTGRWGNLFGLFDTNLWLANKATGVSLTDNGKYGYLRFCYMCLGVWDLGFKNVGCIIIQDKLEDYGTVRYGVACVVTLDTSVSFELVEDGEWNIIDNV